MNWYKKIIFVNLTLAFDVILAQDALRYKNTNISLSGPSIKKKILNFLVPKSYHTHSGLDIVKKNSLFGT